MAVEGQVLKGGADNDVIDFDASADVNPGTFVALPDARLGLYAGAKPAANGERIAAHVRAQVWVVKDAATVFNAGDAVQFNVTTRLAVTTGGVAIGNAIYTAGNGPTRVLVDLNRA